MVGMETWTANAGVLAPDPFQPYWRSEDGTRLTFGDLVEGLSGGSGEAAVAGYSEAICELARAAACARLHGDAQEARRLAIAASRLCHDGGHGNLPVGGHRNSPVTATGSPHGRPSVLPAVSS
jgi:hypothetical protein